MPFRHLSSQVAGLSRSSRASRLHGRTHRQGLGAGRFEGGGFLRIPPGRRISVSSSSPRSRNRQHRFRQGTSPPSLKTRKPGQPFCFWLGGHDPHRPYEDGCGPSRGPCSGKRRSARVSLPTRPSCPVATCSTMLSKSSISTPFSARYWISSPLIGELDDTLILVTSDHGMPFPRVKGQIYEAGFHLPMAVRWGRSGQAGSRG